MFKCVEDQLVVWQIIVSVLRGYIPMHRVSTGDLLEKGTLIPPPQQIQRRHPDSHSILNLLKNDRLFGVGNIAV